MNRVFFSGLFVAVLFVLAACQSVSTNPLVTHEGISIKAISMGQIAGYKPQQKCGNCSIKDSPGWIYSGDSQDATYMNSAAKYSFRARRSGTLICLEAGVLVNCQKSDAAWDFLVSGKTPNGSIVNFTVHWQP